MRRAWTSDEIETVRINYADWPTFLVAYLVGRSECAVYGLATKLGLHKSAKYLASPWACRLRRGDNPGVAYRFPKGNVPANKGLRRPGYAPGRMAETQFKKGRPAREARNYVPIGTEKYDVKRKTIVRKITDDPALFPVARWRPVHVLVWEAAHGPVPDGHIVIFRPGMKTLVSADITLDRLELVTLAENMRRNTIHNLPEPLRKAITARGSLVRSINRRTRATKRKTA